MDNVTHTLFALTLARTPLGRAGRGATTALLLASNAPDVDIVSTVGGAVSYLRWHRGPTHGPLGILGLGLATAGLVWAGRLSIKPRPSEPEASFGMLAGISTLAVLLHVLMDLPTSYGTRVLSPFDWHWFALDWMPIVDVYLLIVLVGGLLIASRSEAARQRSAAIVLALVAALYGVRGAAHHEAMRRAPKVFAASLSSQSGSCPDPSRGGPLLDIWPATLSTPDNCLIEIAALPSFASPFTWQLIAKWPDVYEVRQMTLFAPGGSRSVSTRYPNRWTAEVFKAASTNVARTFLGFSRFPAAQSVTDRNGNVTVHWRDIRFVPTSDLFTATVRLDASGRTLREGLGR